MDGRYEIEEKDLPKRMLRGTTININENAHKEKDPKILGWKQLSKGNWTCSKSLRDAGVEHFVQKLLESGLRVDRLYDLVENVRNQMHYADEDP